MTGAVEAHRKGVLLVLGAAICWSSGGPIARFISADSGTQMVGRGFFAAVTLLLFLLIRDGRNTWALFRGLGLPGLMVAVLFAIASSSFVVALQHATVALILVIQSTAPLIAGLIAFLWMREPIGWVRGIAMLVALLGVWQMVSGQNSGGDAIGIALSCAIALSIGLGTVMVRRYRAIRMTPAMCIAATLLMSFGLVSREAGPVSAPDIALLLLFGAGQLAIGMILFTTGTRLLPAGEAALLGLLECVLGPLWVWLIIGEDPGRQTILGGLLTLAAVAGNTVYDMLRAGRSGTAPDRPLGGPA